MVATSQKANMGARVPLLKKQGCVPFRKKTGLGATSQKAGMGAASQNAGWVHLSLRKDQAWMPLREN